jgi:tetratricopeptide (TPR) repeat protein
VSESLELRRRTGDALGIATALNALGGVFHFRGDLDRARKVFEESLAIKKALGNESAVAVALTNLGLVERDAGRPQPAADAFREAIAIWERTGDRQRVAVGIHNAALLALDLGAYADAAAGLDRAHEIARQLGDRTEMAYAMADRVRVDVERGDLEAAEAALGESLPRALGQSLRIVIALGLEGAGTLAAARGEDEVAVRLWAAAAAERASSGFANMPADKRLLDARIDGVRERMDPARFAAAWGDGLALTADRAAAEAMTLVAAAVPGAP